MWGIINEIAQVFSVLLLIVFNFYNIYVYIIIFIFIVLTSGDSEDWVIFLFGLKIYLVYDSCDNRDALQSD